MKPNYPALFFGALFLFNISLFAAAVPETEPNDNIATADAFSQGDTATGVVGPTSGNNNDYFASKTSGDGTVTVYFTVTNNSGNSGADIVANIYNANGTLITGKTSSNVPAGTTRRDSFLVYCLAEDSVFLQIFSSLDFSYELSFGVDAPLYTNDAEPNDSFAVAQPLAEDTWVDGHISYSKASKFDANDYYRAVLGQDGTLVLRARAQNTSNSASADFFIDVYDKNFNFIATYSSSNVPPGGTVKEDSLRLFCRAADTLYFRVSSRTGCYAYQIFYEVEPPLFGNDAEPNDSFAVAQPLAEETWEDGHIRYATANGLGNFDEFDYYRSVLDKDGTLVLRARAQNTSNSASADFFIDVYDKNFNFIATYSSSNVPPGGTVKEDSLRLFCRAADTLYFRVSSRAAGCYAYQIFYEVEPPLFGNDAEPNDSFAVAQPLAEETWEDGHIRYATANGLGNFDEFDYYRSVLDKDGTLVLRARAQNTSNSASADFFIDVFDKNFNFIATYSSSNVPPGSTVKEDSLRLFCRAADTLYFRVSSRAGCYAYQIYYEVEPPLFGNDAEPNDSFAVAQPLAEDVWSDGHIRYANANGLGNFDEFDYYRSVLSEDGTLVLRARAQNTSNIASADFDINVYDKNFSLIANYSSDNVPGGGTVKEDSLRLFCRAADTVYFRVSSSGCYAYQIYYEIESSGPRDAEPNNSFAEATMVATSDTTFGTNGHISPPRDNNDYFKFYNSGFKEIDLVFTFKNTGLSTFSGDFFFYLYDENEALIAQRNSSNTPPQVEITDSFSLSCPPLDTFYFRVASTGECLGYNFHFNAENGLFFADTDNDGFGDPDDSVFTCGPQPVGFVADSLDCDDTDSTVNPNAVEICDGIDNNCDGQIDEGTQVSDSSTVTICDGDSALIGGVFRTMAGTFTDTIFGTGCDSISTITVVVNPTFDSTITIVTCDMNLAGTTVDSLLNQFGCDSVITNEVIFDGGDSTKLDPIVICTGDSILIGGQFRTTAGNYFETLQNQNGCDSVVCFDVRVLPVIYDVDEMSDTSAIDIYNNAQYINDSVLRVESVGGGFSSGQAWYVADKVKVDEPFESDFDFRIWNGTADGLVFVIQNESSMAQGGSGAGVGYDGITRAFAIEMDIFQNAGESDNHVAIHSGGAGAVSFTQSDRLATQDPPFDLNDGNVHNFRVNYLDDTVRIYLDNSTFPLIEYGVDLNALINSGNGDSTAWFGFTASRGGESANHDVLNWTIKGCVPAQGDTCPTIDSITVANTTCDPNQVGSSSMTFTGSDGCDSVVTTVTTLLPSSNDTTAPITICDGDSALVFGNFETMAGTFTDSSTNAAGCDSITVTELIVNPSFNDTTAPVVICQGDSAMIFGNFETVAGTFTDLSQTVNGCDSITTTELRVVPQITTKDTLTICEGDSAMVFGNFENMAGIFTDTTMSAGGCDSIATVCLMVNDTNMTTVMDSICPGDSLFVGGSFQTVAGTFSDVFTNEDGCDSTVNTILTIRTDSACNDTVVIPGDCGATVISDATFMESTVVTPTNLSGQWNGVNGNLPPASSYTKAAEEGQPYSFPTIDPVDSAKVIKAGNNIRYFRQLFTLQNNDDLAARFRLSVDDQAEVYVNGKRVVADYSFGQSTYKNPPLDAQFNTDGTTDNPNMGNEPFDFATGMNLDNIFQMGQNEVVVVVRNLGKASDRGGFSFRMDVECTDTAAPPRPVQDSCVSDTSWRRSTVVTPSSLSGTWMGTNGLPADSTFILPVDTGQPYSFATIERVSGTHIIKSENNIRYYRKEFRLDRADSLDARFRATFDDQVEIYVNGTKLLRENTVGRANYKLPAHDILFNGASGTFVNGNAGGEMYDFVGTNNLDTVFKTGVNTLTVALRNFSKASDRGGFSFRLDVTKGGQSVLRKGSRASSGNGFASSESLDISAFPNPASDRLTVLLPTLVDAQSGTLTISDLNGRAVFVEERTAGSPPVLNIDLSKMAGGVYFLRYEQGGEIVVEKILKE